MEVGCYCQLCRIKFGRKIIKTNSQKSEIVGFIMYIIYILKYWGLLINQMQLECSMLMEISTKRNQQ